MKGKGTISQSQLREIKAKIKTKDGEDKSFTNSRFVIVISENCMTYVIFFIPNARFSFCCILLLYACIRVLCACLKTILNASIRR